MKFDFKVIAFSILAGMLVWISDAFLDHLFFSGKSFLDLLIIDMPEHKLFIRILIILYFFLFGSVIAAYANKQKKSTEELQDFEFRYKTIADKASNWEFWKNNKGGYHYLSPAFERITGYLVEDLKQNPSLMKKIIHPDDLERVTRHLEDEVKNTMEISELEFRIVTQNNEVKRIKHTCQPVYDKNGKFKGTRGSNIEIPEQTIEHSIDITDYSRIKDSLKTSEEQFNVIFDYAPDAFYLHDLKGTIINCNKAAEELSGYERKELIGKNFLGLKLLNISDAVKAARLLAENALGDPTGPEEFIINRKNGEKITVEIRNFPVKIKENTLVFGIARNISERKQAEDAMRTSKAYMENIITSMTDALFVVAPDATIQTVNTAAVTLLGYSKDELIGKPIETVFGEGGKEEVFTEQVLSMVEKKLQIIYDRDPEDFWSLLKTAHLGTVIVGSDGKIVMVNEQTESIFGYDQGELIGKMIHVLLPAKLRDAHEKKRVGFMASPSPRYMGKGQLLKAQRKDGTTFAVEVGLFPLQIDGDTHVVSVIQDPSRKEMWEFIGVTRFGKLFSEEEVFWDVDRTLVTKNSEKIQVLISGSIMRDDSDEIQGAVLVAKDITQRKKAEKALRESEERFRGLYENSSMGIYRSTPEGKIIMANPAALNLLGYSSLEEILKLNFADGYCDPSERKRFREIMDSEGTIHGFEIEWKKPDGTVVDLRESARTVTDEEGNVSYYEGVFEDITEQKLGQNALMESERKFRQLIEQAPDGIFRTDSNGKFILANTKTCNLLGYTKEEIYQLNIIDTYPTPEEQEIAKQRFGQLQEGDNLRFERNIKRKDGSIFPVESSIEKLEDSSIQEIIHDITRRKRNELLQNAVYQISEASDKAKSLDDLYKSVHKIIVSVMPADNFFIASYDDKKDLLSFDYFVDEIDDYQDYAKPGKGFTAYVLRTGKSLFLDDAAQEKLLKTGEVEAIGTKSPIWLGVPLIIENKTIGAMVVQHYSDPNAYSKNDLHLLEYVSSQIAKAIITNRTEEELRKLSSAVKQSSATIIITDTLGNVEYVNPKFTEVTGYSSDEVKGKNTRILESGLTTPEEHTNLWNTIKSGNEWHGEIRNKKKNGELYWESSSISPIRNAEGEITHFLAVKEDITEKKKIEMELIESKEKAEEMSRLKSNFLANMSHELRTPLIGIIGFAEMLVEELENEEKKQMAESILQSGERLSRTLDLILDLSMLESDKLNMNKHKVNILDAIKESIYSSRQAARKKGLKFNFESNGKEIYCNVDKKLFGRAIHYFLDNSIKFTQKGSISIKVFTNGNATIQITDTGIGISKEKLKLIFQPFRQASEGNSRKYEGTGLGLTLAKKFIEVLGGTVTVKSEEAKGAIFTIEFPEVK